MAESTEQSFDPQAIRPLLFSIAYRMLGQVAAAEDVVQDAFLRWHRTQRDGVRVESPKAFLATVTTRLAIDELRSARARRESYVGVWLPEPVVEEREPAAERDLRMAESLSMAFLLVLDALSPVERAVFLLREVFDYEYADIAAIVDKTEANCRQVFARAKHHIESGKPRFEASPEARDRLAERFFAACRHGRLDELVALLASDVSLYGDGGGKAIAVGQPLHGAERVAKFVYGLFLKARERALSMKVVSVNGQPGVEVFDADGRVVSVLALHIADGSIVAVRSIVNPDKLAHLGPVSDALRLPLRSAPQPH
jgi:RNA polymerase sigma-70 factor (ECF subfamily)